MVITKGGECLGNRQHGIGLDMGIIQDAIEDLNGAIGLLHLKILGCEIKGLLEISGVGLDRLFELLQGLLALGHGGGLLLVALKIFHQADDLPVVRIQLLTSLSDGERILDSPIVTVDRPHQSDQ